MMLKMPSALMVAVAMLLASGCTYIGRASLDNAGLEVDGSSRFPSASGSGRYVAFQSNASTLVASDTNRAEDIFVRDMIAGTTVRVSLADGGAQARAGSRYPAISADGRYVAFESDAANLVTGDTNGVTDIFVRDIVAGTTKRVSVGSSGVQANGLSRHPAISDDGFRVAFQSEASNLVPFDSNRVRDIFLHDQVSGVMKRVSVPDGGGESNGVSGEGWGIDFSWASRPSLSADGRYVAFESVATNLVASDTNGKGDVFVRDVVGNTTILVSMELGGGQISDDSSQPTVSDDGRYIAFVTRRTARFLYIFEVNVFDTLTQTSSLINGSPQGALVSTHPSISGDGRFIAWEQLVSIPGGFYGNATHVRDTVRGTTTNASATNMFVQSTEPNYDISRAIGQQHPSLTGDGRYVTFGSAAPDIVRHDHNAGAGCNPIASHPNCNFDIFVRRTVLPTVTNVSPASARVGTNVTITVNGTGFDGVDQGLITGKKIKVTAMRVLSDTRLELDLTLDVVANLRTRSVIVIDSGTLGGATGSSGQCVGCFKPLP